MSLPLMCAAGAAQVPQELYAPILGDLGEVERILAGALASACPGIAELVRHVSRYRGKRLRPALLLLVARACGGVTPAHHVLAAVIEMIHTATLVHDDVLDGASLRRHVPTVNAVRGNHNSVLLGDYIFTHAFTLSTTLGDLRACQIIGAASNRVCEGELRQGLERGNLALGEAQYLEMIDGKTAELIACCGRLGALFASASDEVVERMACYARNLGMAFQIADDLLDLVGEERATGKSLGTDLEQQKMTLPLIRLLGRAPAAVAQRLRQALASPGNHKRDLLRPYLADSDALDYAYARAEDFARAARAELECLPESPCRAILESLCERVVHRDG
ncbi:MAG TPA: polyprenyl synthetase family protein [Gemmataceae bacterium]|nr:polyprenyl synthetase family protein [Gemmataceae bacterium]